MANTKLDSSEFAVSRFVNTDMHGASLQECSFSNAIFYRTNLNHANFHNADLRAATFFEVDLSHVDFTNVNLEGCAYDASTKFPSGFNPAKHGMEQDDSPPPSDALNQLGMTNRQKLLPSKRD